MSGPWRLEADVTEPNGPREEDEICVEHTKVWRYVEEIDEVSWAPYPGRRYERRPQILSALFLPTCSAQGLGFRVHVCHRRFLADIAQKRRGEERRGEERRGEEGRDKFDAMKEGGCLHEEGSYSHAARPSAVVKSAALAVATPKKPPLSQGDAMTW
jgi:hypothetical protein